MNPLAAAALAAGTLGLAATASAQSLTCISDGTNYSPGQIVCIPGCHGAQRLARCDIVAGQSLWITVSDNCPTANMSRIPEYSLASFSPRPRASGPWSQTALISGSSLR